MSPNLKGKVCLVTGATKGIGRGIALQLGSSGAKVYLTGRTEELLQSCAKEINERGGEAFPIKVDHGNDKVVFFIHNTIYLLLILLTICILIIKILVLLIIEIILLN